MNTTQRTALINEGKTIIKRTDEDSWRLAEIVRDLHSDGMTYQAIADEFGWKHRGTAEIYAHAVRTQHPRFQDAFLFAGMSEDRAIAVAAVAEAEGISPHTAKTRASVKELVAEIANLPEDEKKQAAKELALDTTIQGEAMSAANKSLSDKRNAHRRDNGIAKEPRTALDDSLVISTLQVLDVQAKKAICDMVEVEGEVLSIVMEYIQAITETLEVIEGVVTGAMTVNDWDNALKEIV